MKIKTVFSLLIALAIPVSMVACAPATNDPEESKTEADSKETMSVDTTDTQSQETESDTATEEISDDVYANLIETYQTAIAESWGPDQLAAKELSELCFFENGDNGQGNIGYAIQDVTGDEGKELIVGSLSAESDKVVFDLYTVVDGHIVRLCSSTARNRYYLSLAEDAGTACMLINYGSSGAAQSEWVSYSIGAVEAGELSVTQAILYDAEADAQNPWFLGAYDGEQIIYTSTDADTAMAIMTAAEENYYLPELTAFGK